ncbi:hypothetical protein V8D89_008445 [Ganoderma adspersum]
MSSNVDRYVTTLTGGNYAAWALDMESFLMSQTLKHVLTDTIPVAGQTPTPEELKAIADFKDHDECALGFILLRVSSSIRYTGEVATVTDPHALGNKPIVIPTGSGSMYPTMVEAISLADRLGVPGTAERVRILEDAVIASQAGPSSARIEEVVNSDTESRSSKRSRSTPLIDRIEWADDVEMDMTQTSDGEDAAYFTGDEDDTVSLGSELDNEIAEAAGFDDMYR